MRALILAALLLPLPALAEGNRIVIDCMDSTGTAQSFSLSPVDLDADGVGEITVGPDALPGLSAGIAGPWLWDEGERRHVLLLDSYTGADLHVLYHIHDLSSEPTSSTLTELTCGVPQ